MYEARRKGLVEGEQQEKKRIAKKMKEKGAEMEYIKEMTGLTEEEIKVL